MQRGQYGSSDSTDRLDPLEDSRVEHERSLEVLSNDEQTETKRRRGQRSWSPDDETQPLLATRDGDAIPNTGNNDSVNYPSNMDIYNSVIEYQNGWMNPQVELRRPSRQTRIAKRMMRIEKLKCFVKCVLIQPLYYYE